MVFKSITSIWSNCENAQILKSDLDNKVQFTAFFGTTPLRFLAYWNLELILLFGNLFQHFDKLLCTILMQDSLLAMVWYPKRSSRPYSNFSPTCKMVFTYLEASALLINCSMGGGNILIESKCNLIILQSNIRFKS